MALNQPTVTISSVVIILSLAIAFSSWARTVIFGAFRFSFAYLAHRMRRNKPPKTKNLKGASAQTLREFMIAKQKEWESRDANPPALASGARLPMHNNEDVDEGREKGSGMFNEIAMSRLWRRRKSDL